MTHTHTHTHERTRGRTLLDNGSARRKDLCPTIHNMHKRHPCSRRDLNPQTAQPAGSAPEISTWLLQLGLDITYILYLTLVHCTYHFCFLLNSVIPINELMQLQVMMFGLCFCISSSNSIRTYFKRASLLFV
jgi:hypothetical protein